MNENTPTNHYLLELIIKWKKHFIIVTILSIAASAIFSSSFFIAPIYKSFAIVYPSNIIPYSNESPTEQLVQLLEATDIRESVIQKFNLAAHYNIDTTANLGVFNLIKKYQSNVEISQTQFNSIEIKVFDTDPQLACDMVNEIIKALNLKARSLQRAKTKEVLEIVNNQLLVKKLQMDSINSALQTMRVKYQILDYGIQVKEYSKSYLKALSSGGSKGSIKDIDNMMRNLEEKGGEFYQMKQTFDVVLNSYNTSKLEYDKVESDMNKLLTYTNIISKPIPTDKKSYPIRWLIVFISVISTNLFLLLLIISRNLKNNYVGQTSQD